MKEFDIEKAKAGAPVCTRDGRPVRIICFDFQEYGRQEEEEKYPIIALVKCDKGERAYVYRESGKCKIDKNDELMMAPVKHEAWVNLLRVGELGVVAEKQVYQSEESAKSASCNNDYYLTSVKVEWEE